MRHRHRRREHHGHHSRPIHKTQPSTVLNPATPPLARLQALPTLTPILISRGVPELLAAVKLASVASYQDGSLALAAQNVSLGEILESIHQSTGAVIEAPILDERMSIQLSTQPPAEAIAALFEGMHLNYAILGGTGDRDRLEAIIVTFKPDGEDETAPAQVVEQAAIEARARAAARFTEETGGDEGVWDNGPR